MSLLYIANIRLPTEKAHGIQIMKTCEALAKAGIQVELIVPKRRNKITEAPFNFYGVLRNFMIKKLWSLDVIWWPMPQFLKKIAFWKQSMTFALSALSYVRKNKNIILYTRDLLFALVLPKEKLYYEVHWLPEKLRWYHRRAYARVKGLIVISEGIKNDLIKFGISEEKICIARDAVDVQLFNIPDALIEYRGRLNFPLDKKIVMYTGHLYEWKGVETLLEVAQQLPEYLFIFVGGTDEDLRTFRQKAWKEQIDNVLILGHRSYSDMPFYLKAADVLVLPNSAQSRIGAKDTSPLKLFEYMTAGRPIVASDVPAIREILDTDMAELIMPDDVKSLVDGIRTALENVELSKRRVEKAYDEVLRYTWDKRAEKILSFVI